MKKKMKKDLSKRKESMQEFYYKGIGDRIKKKRLELKLTQESLAKGICSNTYISKIENQKTIAKSAPLNLIMEKMDMDGDKIAFPEELIPALEQSIEYFYYNDIKSYKKLYDRLAAYEFGTLLNIIRLGYFVLIEDFEKASPLYNEMFRYLNTLEEYGLSIFLIYAGYFCVGNHDFTTARMIIEMTKNRILNDDRVIALYSQLCLEVYGELHILELSPLSIDDCTNIYMNRYNPIRLEQTAAKKEIFRNYKKNKDVLIHQNKWFANLSKNQFNHYLFALINASNNPVKYVDQMHKYGAYYMEGLFVKAKYLLEKEEKEDYKKVLKEMNSLYYELGSKVDYVGILNHYELKDDLFVKEKLISYVLPFAQKMQNIQWIQLICDEIVDILRDKNRYKDALIYQIKKESIVKELQFYKD